MNKSFFYCILILFFFTSFRGLSQNNNERLKVFIDCKNSFCDQTYIKTEITIVDFLLDPFASDVHIIISSNSTGGGGIRYQMIFYGQKRLNKIQDTLYYNADALATKVELRELQLKYLKLGLVPFITKTGVVSDVAISMKQDTSLQKKYDVTFGKKDPWNYWVFTIHTDGNISSEKLYKNFGYNTNFSASRITEELKTSVSIFGNFNKATYTFENGPITEKFIARNSFYGLHHYLVKSINNHWSTGYEAILNSSTFSNLKLQLYIRTAVEYNIFPYKEVNNRFLTLSYGIITRFNRYYDTTLYDKLNETLYAHSFRVNFDLNKKWGTVNSGMFYSNFFHNWKLNSLGVNINVNVRITGGLSFNIYSSGGLVHDQVYLPKSGATQQEILTRLRQLKSSYNFQTRVGINYQFGSKLNNFVNPRFNGG